MLLARPTCHAYTSLPLTYEKSLGSRGLLLLNLISHYLPLKSPASTKRGLTTSESTVEPESNNDGYRISSDASMTPCLTLSVLLSPIWQLEGLLSCPNRKQRSMRSALSDFTLKAASVLIHHARKTLWRAQQGESPQGAQSDYTTQLDAPRTTIKLACLTGAPY